MQPILVVDDDRVQVDVVSFLLRRASFDPVTAFDADSARELFATQPPLLVILDIQLGQDDGRDLLKQFKRQRPDIPVLMLTVLNAEDDRVYGLELGADDYLAKPFGYRELIARVRALLRRGKGDVRERAQPRRLELGPVVLDPLTHEVTRDGERVDVSPTEFRLLQTLMERPNELVATRSLLQQVWGHQDMTARNVVRVTASRLRAKLEKDPAHPRFLQTVPGEGLIFRVEAHPQTATDATDTRPPAGGGNAVGPSAIEGPVALEVIAELRELMGQMGNEPLQQLNDVFVQSARNHLIGMRTALGDGNADELSREAHRLRGASGSVGAQRVARVCATIEERARAADLTPVDEMLDQLEAELADFEQAIVPMLS
jgi:DNA-binding response OmpR family regulator/HPt (histidine-containing phosphotransfer) domain-containing protein